MECDECVNNLEVWRLGDSLDDDGIGIEVVDGDASCMEVERNGGNCDVFIFPIGKQIIVI